MKTTRILPALVLAAALPGAALGAGAGPEIEDTSFSFEGPFGSFDRLQLQRGFQVYHTVCRACHGMKFVAFRELGNADGPGFPEDQVKAIASEYFVPDPEGEPGDEREGRPSDRFPEVVAAGAPDLSLMAKKRAGFHGPAGLGINQLFKGIGGPEYIKALLDGYADTPECAADVDMGAGYYNTVFINGSYPDECKIFEENEVPVLDANGDPVLDANGEPKTAIERVEVGRQVPGSWISMAPPLWEDAVEYTLYGAGPDASVPPATVEQMSKDVAAFLMWAAEPKMMERKSAGLRNFIMIVILAVLLYYTNKKLWASVKRKDA